MVAKVQTSVIHTLIKHISSKKKVAVSLKFNRDNTLYIQSKNDVVATSFTEYKGEPVDESFCIEIDRSIEILSKLGNEVTIFYEPHFDSVRMENGLTRLFFKKSFEVFLDDGVDYSSNVVRSGVDFSILKGKCKSFDALAKSIQVGNSGVQFCNQKGYILYSNSVLVFNVNGYIPSKRFSSAVLSSISSAITSDVSISEFDDGLVSFKAGDSNITVSLQDYDEYRVNQINDLISGMSIVHESYNTKTLSIIPNSNKYFPNKKVHVVVYYDGESGFSIFDSNGTALQAGIQNESPLLSIQISTIQFDLIEKIFSNSNVKVWKGNNCICLQTESQTLLLSGLIY